MLRFLVFCFLSAAAFAQNKTVYLTFDDGPQIGTTDVLDVLKEQGAHATFFLTGSNAISVGGFEGQATIVKRTLAEGHELGNHCYIHSPMKKAEYTGTYGDLSTEGQRTAFRNNYARNLDHFRARLQQPEFKFAFARLPGDGSTFPALVRETEALGMRHFGWNYEFATGPVGFTWLKATDWHGIQGVRAEEVELPVNGAVILFHDRHWAGENKAKLAAIIALLKEKGYTFGKLADVKPRPAKPPAATPSAPATPTTPTPAPVRAAGS
jgi:peptidoglycan/xylan/chitin deacetylase (PgdA/CDA1 family)